MPLLHTHIKNFTFSSTCCALMWYVRRMEDFGERYRELESQSAVLERTLRELRRGQRFGPGGQDGGERGLRHRGGIRLGGTYGLHGHRNEGRLAPINGAAPLPLPRTSDLPESQFLSVYESGLTLALSSPPALRPPSLRPRPGSLHTPSASCRRA